MTIDGSLKHFRPRYFDEVDTVTGTPEADTFEVDAPGFKGGLPRDLFVPRPEPEEEIRVPGRGTAPKEQPETTEIVVLDDGGEWICAGKLTCRWVPNAKSLDDGTIVEEVDILVYQEQERDYYLEGFQAPTARSYTLIRDFDPIEDFIVIGVDHYRYDVDDSEFRVVDDLEFRIADDLEFRIADDYPCEIPFVCF